MSAYDRISKIFSEHLNVEVPDAETDLFETGVLDSLAFVDLLARIEAEFGITISVDELSLDDFRSIERIAVFVISRDGGPVAGSPRQRAG